MFHIEKKENQRLVRALGNVKGCNDMQVISDGESVQFVVQETGVYIRYDIEHAKEKECKCVVDMDLFRKIMQANENVSIEVDNGLRISGYVSSFVRGSNFGSDDYMQLPNGKKVTAQISQKAFEYCVRSVSDDITREHLNNYLIAKKGVVSTDGHRMHMVGKAEGRTFVMHRRAYKIAKMYGFEKGESICCVCINNEYSGIRTGNISVFVKIMDDKYPPYEQVVPRSNLGRIEVDTGELVKGMLAIQKIIPRKNLDSITFETLGDKLRVSYGECFVDIHCISNLRKVFGVRAKYMIDALRKECSTTSIEYGNPLDPVVVRYENSMAIVMPVRLS